MSKSRIEESKQVQERLARIAKEQGLTVETVVAVSIEARTFTGQPFYMACSHCGQRGIAFHMRRKVCSVSCERKARWARTADKSRPCGECGTVFEIANRQDANRRYCSKQCAKRAHTKSIKKYEAKIPGFWQRINKKRLAANPGYWREKSAKDRLRILELLGGACVVCGVTRTCWLHVDYIPTTMGQPFRHPRGIAFIKTHREDFRILCANHHYELSLTGRIEGTDIRQMTAFEWQVKQEQAAAVLADAS